MAFLPIFKPIESTVDDDMALEIDDPSLQELEEQKQEIEDLIDRVFLGTESINFEQYKLSIKENTSEMFICLMQVLHSNLPCSKAIFQIKEGHTQL